MIALTNGQLRRRWLNRWLTLLAMLTASIPFPRLALPTFMALLFKDGMPIMRDDKPAMGTCADCCGGGCSTCVSGLQCRWCSGDTPTQWHLSFIDVENAMGCTTCSDFNITLGGGTGTLGTYTLTQVSGCLWNFTIPDPAPITIKVGVNSLGDDPCARTFTNDLTVSLTQLPSTRQVAASFGGFGTNFLFFNGTASGTDCCAEFTVSNSQTTYSCPNDARVGINGHGVGTPC